MQIPCQICKSLKYHILLSPSLKLKREIVKKCDTSLIEVAHQDVY